MSDQREPGYERGDSRSARSDRTEIDSARIASVIDHLHRHHATIFGSRPTSRFTPCDPPRPTGSSFHHHLLERMEAICGLVSAMATQYEGEVAKAIDLFASWMDDGAIVRVLGAGRARLAAAIPANRLAHGGARVYLQDDVVPMPHSLHGGGVIAASASGKTPSVLSALQQVRAKNKDIAVVGIAAETSIEFRELCSVFIGIPQLKGAKQSSLSALADIQEYAISELTDALVVAAGLAMGYTDASWRLGHEDLGPATGPYDFKPVSP